MRDHSDNAGHRLDTGASDFRYPAKADGRADDDGVELARLVEVGGIMCPAGDLGASVDTSHGPANDVHIHATSPAISSARTMVLGNRPTLNPLWCNGRTPSVASCA